MVSFRPIKKGSVDESVVIRIIDSTDGSPENAVDYDTSGIDLWYRRDGATKTSITEAALASLDAAHSDGGIELIGDGYYRLDLPDAAYASGADGVAVGGTITGMIVIGCYVPLVDYDPYDAAGLGLSTLSTLLSRIVGTIASGTHNAQSGDAYARIGANGAGLTAVTAATVGDKTGYSLATSPPTAAAIRSEIDSNSTQLAALIARLTAARAGYLDNLSAGAVALATALATAQADLDLLTGADGATLATSQPNYAPNTVVPPSVAQFEARTLVAALYGTAANQSTIAGYIDTEIAAILAAVDTEIAAIKTVTDALPDAGALTTIAADCARLTAARAQVLTDLIDGGRLDLLVDAIKAKTDNLPDGIAKNTAMDHFPIVMVLSSDHVTPATGKTVTGTRSLDGGAFASVTGSISEISNGAYDFVPAAADTNCDVGVWRFSADDCDDTWVTFKTEE